jgi:hypothetical protein
MPHFRSIVDPHLTCGRLSYRPWPKRTLRLSCCSVFSSMAMVHAAGYPCRTDGSSTRSAHSAPSLPFVASLQSRVYRPTPQRARAADTCTAVRWVWFVAGARADLPAGPESEQYGTRSVSLGLAHQEDNCLTLQLRAIGASGPRDGMRGVRGRQVSAQTTSVHCDARGACRPGEGSTLRS